MTNIEIGKRIKNERERQGLTLREVADKIGVAASTIQRYEAGSISKIKLPVIEAIANKLNVNPAWLIGKSNDKRPINHYDVFEKGDNSISELTAKDERDIAKDLSFTLEQLESAQTGIMFDGEPLDDETRELLKISLENSIRLGKQIAKQKYTNKRYKKD